jgi:hypothetical protein
VLSVVLTWPLARHFASHVPGDGIDDPALAWNLWWIKTRLVDQLNLDIFHVGWMFHPIEINLAFYTLTPLNGLLSVPLQTAASLVVANNLLLVASFILGGYGAYLLCLTVWPPPTRDERRVYEGAALCAGIIYAFASSKLFYVSLGQFNIASSQWLPFCMLYLWRLGRSRAVRPALRNGLMAGLFLSFQAWAELTYASFLFLFAALLALWQLAGLALQSSRHLDVQEEGGHGAQPEVCNLGPQDSTPMIDVEHARSTRFATLWSAWGPLVAGYAGMGLLFVAALLPFLAAMIPDLRAEGDFFASGGGFADTFSADLLGFWLPSRLHPLFGAWAAKLPFANDKGQQIFLGYSALAAAVVGIGAGWAAKGWRRRATGFWLVAWLIFAWLSLGPWVRWAGIELSLPGPFALVSRLPFFSGNRYPSRYSVLVMLCLAVLAAYGLIWLGQRVRRVRWPTTLPALLVGTLFLAEHLAVPLPLSDFRIPPIYERLAAEAGDFAVLELPTGWRNGARVLGYSDKLIMFQQWYQTAHGKRRLGGNTSRNPEYKFQYFTETPILGDLIALMNANRAHLAPVLESEYPALVARAQADAAKLLGFLDVRYVMLHLDHAPELLMRYVEEALPLELVDEWRGPDWTGAPSIIRLYAVQPPGAAPAPADLATPQAHHHLAAGWSAAAVLDGPRYTGRESASLLVDLPVEGGALRLQLGSPAPLSYRLNGVKLANQSEGEWLTLNVPLGAAGEPVDHLALAWPSPGAPVAQLSAAAQPEGAAIGATNVRLAPGASLVVRSAGEEVGDFAHITVNGVEHAPNTRGYNLVALAPGGTVLEVAAFDTFAPGESARLAAWVRRLPERAIVAGAVADEASLNLTQEAVSALGGLGVSGDLRGKFRWSHAFIGVAGAPPGAAQESLSLLQPATVFAGLPVDTPQVTGAVQQLEVIPPP